MAEHSPEVKANGIGWRAACPCGWVGFGWRLRVDAAVDCSLHRAVTRTSASPNSEEGNRGA